MTKLVIIFRIWAVSDNLDPILTPKTAHIVLSIQDNIFPGSVHLI